jgi:hypothetical protein
LIPVVVDVKQNHQHFLVTETCTVDLSTRILIQIYVYHLTYSPLYAVSNQAARIRQWERAILVSVDQLHAIKLYRTPQGLRSFARLFSVFLPPFFAPYYAQLAMNVNSIGLAIAFAIVTSIALTSLFETINQMEDPFATPFGCSTLDGIDVTNELIESMQSQLLALRKQYFPQAPALIDKTTAEIKWRRTIPLVNGTGR